MKHRFHNVISFAMLSVLFIGFAGCKTSHWTAWLDSDSMTPSLGFDMVPRQSEPPIQDETDINRDCNDDAFEPN